MEGPAAQVIGSTGEVISTIPLSPKQLSEHSERQPEGVSSLTMMIVITPGTALMQLQFDKAGKSLLSSTLTRRQAQTAAVICKGHTAQARGLKSGLSDSTVLLLTSQFMSPTPQVKKGFGRQWPDQCDVAEAGIPHG